MPTFSLAALTPILLLCVSNIFMTVAWYGHLKFKQEALWLVILISWGIAFVEYCFAVPANRYGHGGLYTAAELKTIQEVISLTVFAVFSVLYLGESFSWMHAAGFACIAFGAFLVFQAG
ncbi:DMT family protein [Thalassospiraceae bacterium LMO-SO8]|nr:DMT family protein [Alphaproteobacteria bacterium LMO-S08]WND76594.1 DMT family protein [Thalassospiraceae bacterium LMO-SO8]